MFRLIGWVIKTALFAALILVVGQIIQWNGKSVSDQIKTGLSHAERVTPKNLSIDTDELGQKVKNAFDFSDTFSKAKSQFNSKTNSKTKKESASNSRQTPSEEKIPTTDKKELRALLDQAD